jgi:hypothetical protein
MGGQHFSAAVLVPGFGGPIAIVLALAVVVFAVVTAYAVGRRRGVAGAAVGVAVCVLVGLTLRAIPTELNNRRLQYRNQSAFDAGSSELEVQRSVGVDGRFLAFAATELPPRTTFYVTAGKSITTSAPQSWAQWALMPRVEEYLTPCRADWILFVESTPDVDGLRLAIPRRFGSTNNWIARVKAPCTT